MILNVKSSRPARKKLPKTVDSVYCYLKRLRHKNNKLMRAMQSRGTLLKSIVVRFATLFIQKITPSIPN